MSALSPGALDPIVSPGRVISSVVWDGDSGSLFLLLVIVSTSAIYIAAAPLARSAGEGEGGLF